LAYYFRNVKYCKKFLLGAVLIFYLFSNSFIRKEAYRYWEYPFTTFKDTCDYAVVLGGYSLFDYSASRITFTESGDRLFQSYQLYQQGRVKKILLTGGSGSVLHPEKTEADKVRDFLISLKVPEQDIILENASRNTYENAINTAQWISKNDSSAKCLLVTSALHMPRALGCFKKTGLNIIPYTADRLSEPRQFDPENLLIPNPDNLNKWSFLFKEMIGILAYKMKGYI
jgi:uncharacterized SAM-binding protein YcdF (DUF218 family)